MVNISLCMHNIVASFVLIMSVSPQSAPIGSSVVTLIAVIPQTFMLGTLVSDQTTLSCGFVVTLVTVIPHAGPACVWSDQSAE